MATVQYFLCIFESLRRIRLIRAFLQVAAENVTVFAGVEERKSQTTVSESPDMTTNEHDITPAEEAKADLLDSQPRIDNSNIITLNEVSAVDKMTEHEPAEVVTSNLKIEVENGVQSNAPRAEQLKPSTARSGWASIVASDKSSSALSPDAKVFVPKSTKPITLPKSDASDDLWPRSSIPTDSAVRNDTSANTVTNTNPPNSKATSNPWTSNAKPNLNLNSASKAISSSTTIPTSADSVPDDKTSESSSTTKKSQLTSASSHLYHSSEKGSSANVVSSWPSLREANSKVNKPTVNSTADEWEVVKTTGKKTKPSRP
jgi:hypothetical protein